MQFYSQNCIADFAVFRTEPIVVRSFGLVQSGAEQGQQQNNRPSSPFVQSTNHHPNDVVIGMSPGGLVS